MQYILVGISGAVAAMIIFLIGGFVAWGKLNGSIITRKEYDLSQIEFKQGIKKDQEKEEKSTSTQIKEISTLLKEESSKQEARILKVHDRIDTLNSTSNEEFKGMRENLGELTGLIRGLEIFK